jgi:hypothetical protein
MTRLRRRPRRQDAGMRTATIMLLVLVALAGCDKRGDCVVTPNDTVECS